MMIDECRMSIEEDIGKGMGRKKPQRAQKVLCDLPLTPSSVKGRTGPSTPRYAGQVRQSRGDPPTPQESLRDRRDRRIAMTGVPGTPPPPPGFYAAGRVPGSPRRGSPRG